MTTPSTPRKAGPLLGTGAQTSWPFTFKVFAASDIAVTIANNLGVETALVLGTDYSVSVNANQDTSPGGTVTYPLSGSPLPVGSKLTIIGNLPYDQPLDLPSGGNFSPLALENELDRLTMQLQQLREQVGRSLTVPVTSSVSPSLPAPIASNIIGWNESGSNLENYPLTELATSLAFATFRYDTFNGDGVTTQFTLSADPVTLGNLDVAISGVTQVPGTDYTLANGVLQFTSAPANGTVILARFGEGIASGPSMDSYDVRFKQAGTGAVDRTAEAKMREAVTVQDFGASSNASASVNLAAFNNALASGAKVVQLVNDGGTFLVNGTINVPSGVTLLGRGLPIVKLQNGSFGSGGAVIALTSTTGSTVDGIKVDANRQNNTGTIYGINGNTCVSSAVKNCHVINTSFGIFFVGGNTLKFTGNTVDACAAYGICVKLNDVNATCYNIVISDNECKNCWDGVTGASAEGQGIIVYGATGVLSTNYKNITDVIVSNNVCHSNGRQGITLTAVNDFVVDGNNCYDNVANTALASGILISEACYNGTVTGNTCTNNYDAGILLDIVPQFTPKDYFSYGQVAVTGNSCRQNVRTGIKINSCPFSTISGNQISGRRVGTNTLWGIFLTNGGANNIVGNNVSYCSENGIRVPGLAGATSPQQERVVIADNIITNIVATSSSVYSGLYVDYWSDVKIQNNLFSENTQDLTIGDNASGVTLLDNQFTSNIYTNSSVSIQRWDDEFRTTAAGSSWFSSQFSASGMDKILLGAGFTVPHFGLRWLPVWADNTAKTSSLTTAIHPGYIGQKLTIINYASNAITLKQGAAIDNIGNADVVLALGEMVEYTYTGSLWLQTTAKIATSL